MTVTGNEYAGDFVNLLGSGEEFGVHLSYAVQTEAGGIAQALALARDFADGDNVAVILGDNIFEDTHIFKEAIHSFEHQERGAKIFLKKVNDPQRFGVAELEGDRILSIEEKPKNPKSDFAVTGIYMYDARVFDIVVKLKPSARGELEITDVNNAYIAEGTMSFEIVEGEWTDAGTFDSLLRANNLAAAKMKK